MKSNKTLFLAAMVIVVAFMSTNTFAGEYTHSTPGINGYDPVAFLKAMPGDRIAYGHIAGHYNEAEDLIVDTHGAGIIGDVWGLLDKAYEFFGVFPTLLERDFNIPPVKELLVEVQKIKDIQDKWSLDTSPGNEKTQDQRHSA